jgi:fructokinase
VIVVAGEALVDVITRPDGAVDVVPGGGPFNTARAIGRLGLPVAFAGALSGDDHGRGMARSLGADGVSLDLVQRTDLPTTRALAEVDEHGEARYRFVVDGTSAPRLDAGRLLAAIPPGVAAVHVGTLGLVFDPIAATIEALVDALADDVILVVDPNCRPSAIADPAAYRARLDRILARADVVKVSVADLDYLGGGVEAPMVVVTDGPRPAVVRLGEATRVIEVPVVPVVDTVGAGDTFGGAMLAWLVHAGVPRASVATTDQALAAVRFGLRAAAIVCQRRGADPPTLDDLDGWSETEPVTKFQY